VQGGAPPPNAPFAPPPVIASDDDSTYASSVESDDDSMGSLREFIVNSSQDSGSDSMSTCSDEEDDVVAAESTDEEAEGRTPQWIDTSNIIAGKRTRRPTQRYKDAEYERLMLDDCSEMSSSASEAGSQDDEPEFTCPSDSGEESSTSSDEGRPLTPENPV